MTPPPMTTTSACAGKRSSLVIRLSGGGRRFFLPPNLSESRWRSFDVFVRSPHAASVRQRGGGFNTGGSPTPGGGRDQQGGVKQARLGERREPQQQKDRGKPRKGIDEPNQPRAEDAAVEARESADEDTDRHGDN